MSTLRYLAERLIGRAEAAGDLQGLEGEGAPLADVQSAHVDPVEQAGFRVMAKEGALPPEVVLAKEAQKLRAELGQTEGDDARKAVMARLADVEMRRAMRMEARRRGR